MSDDEVAAKVAKWLSQQGYPLEFATAHEFSLGGFGVARGLYRVDPQASSPREIDVVASKEISDADRTYRVSFSANASGRRTSLGSFLPHRGISMPVKNALHTPSLRGLAKYSCGISLKTNASNN